MKAFVGSLAFYPLAFLSGLIIAILIIVIAPFSQNNAYKLGIYWAQFSMFLLKNLCDLDYEVEGAENIPKSPCVIAIRHSSAWEAIAQVLFLPRQSWVMKRELIYLPIFGLAWILLKPIAINRKAGKTAVSQVIEQGKEKIKKGMFVNICPEGTRMPEDQIGRFGQSAAILAQEAGVDILPVTHNAGRFWKRRGVLKRPGKIKVIIGATISGNNKHYHELTEEVKDWISTNKPN